MMPIKKHSNLIERNLKDMSKKKRELFIKIFAVIFIILMIASSFGGGLLGYM